MDALVVVDKPAGWTSHDVVARVRKAAATRRVGHAGTLDPMATGVLVLGIGRATRLLGHLALHDKEYLATVRLGQSTSTDDADGHTVAAVDASGLSDAAIRDGVTALTGDLLQVPSSVSAIKVDGRRAYARVRDGEQVELSPRAVTVSLFEVTAIRRSPQAPPGCVDVEVRVQCSTGTYVRALARDLGAALGVGGHLTALRRTRVGVFGLDEAEVVPAREEPWDLTAVAVSLDAAITRAFPCITVGAQDADRLVHGIALPAEVARQGGWSGLDGVIGVLCDTHAVALVQPDNDRLRSVVVFAPDH